MIALATFSRAGAAASLLIAGVLLAVPTETHERSDRDATFLPAGAPVTAQDKAVSVADHPTAHRPAAQPRHALESPASLRPGMAGMVVGIDPETGELGMPTPEQLRALSDSPQYEVDHSAAGLLEVHHPDGSVSVDLQGRFQEYATVRIGPDGKKTFRCVDGAESAKRAVGSSTHAPAAPALEER